METTGSSRKVSPPSKLGHPVPKIYLSTIGTDRIRLLPEDLFMSRGIKAASSAQSSSLPNLACDSALEVHPQGLDKGSSGRATKSKLGDNVPENCAKSQLVKTNLTASNHVGLYCSPRVGRKGVDWTDRRGSPVDENYAWNPTLQGRKGSFSRHRRSKTGSNSSVESDSSLRSASHVSTCATSDYTKFTSCDALSLAPNGSSTPTSYPFGRLRRIYSNPEAPKLAITGSPADRLLRDSKSCSDLEGQPGGPVNHSMVEQRLSQEGGTRNMLSPPSIIPPSLLKQFQNSQKQMASYEQVYDEAYKASLESCEDLSARENRIRKWLREVSTPSQDDQKF